MSSWYGTARSNYVRISDEEGLKTIIEELGLKVERDADNLAAFFPSDMSDDGGWPSWVTVYVDDPEDPDSEIEEEHEFDFATDIMPFVAEGQVLVVMSAGAEKERYVTGYSEAFIRQGDVVRRTLVSLTDIYELAQATFGTTNPINVCEY